MGHKLHHTLNMAKVEEGIMDEDAVAITMAAVETTMAPLKVIMNTMASHILPITTLPPTAPRIPLQEATLRSLNGDQSMGILLMGIRKVLCPQAITIPTILPSHTLPLNTLNSHLTALHRPILTKGHPLPQTRPSGVVLDSPREALIATGEGAVVTMTAMAQSLR